MVAGRISTYQENQVSIVKVVELNRGGSRAQGFGQTDSRGLVAVVRTVIDVVGAERAGEKLKEKRGFVGGSPAGVKKSSLWFGRF